MSEKLNRSPKHVDTGALKVALDDAGLDAVLVMSPKNAWYLSGHSRLNSSQRPGAPAPVLVIANRAGETTLVVSRWHSGLAHKVAWTDDIVTYRNYAESAFLCAANALEERGLAKSAIGVEMDYIADGDFSDLRGALPLATFRDAGSTVDAVRVRRSDERQRVSLDAYERMSAAVLRGLGDVTPGETRLDVHNRVMREVLFSGSDNVRGGVGALGEPIVPLVTTRDVPLATGELLALEYSCSYGSHAARLGRTLVVGDAGADADYRSLHDALLTGVGAVRPGTTGGEAAGQIERALDVAGHSLAHPVVGHGLTLGYEDAPVLAAGSTDPVDAGMEVVVEPRVTSGLRLSLRMVVTGDGAVASDTGFAADRPYHLAGDRTHQ